MIVNVMKPQITKKKNPYGEREKELEIIKIENEILNRSQVLEGQLNRYSWRLTKLIQSGAEDNAGF